MLGRRSEPLSFAPFRLTAIHAAELYLSALLVHGGRSVADVRALGHDVAARANLASELGLKLRKRTLQHLGALRESREYLVSRYGVETRSLSQVNRLIATLEELSEKVRISILASKNEVEGVLTESAEAARR